MTCIFVAAFNHRRVGECMVAGAEKMAVVAVVMVPPDGFQAQCDGSVSHPITPSIASPRQRSDRDCLQSYRGDGWLLSPVMVNHELMMVDDG